MENDSRVLLAWINRVLKTSFDDYSELYDGVRYCQILRLIEDFDIADNPLPQNPSWSIVLSNLKRVSRHLGSHYKKRLTTPFDPEFVDLLSIAQNRNEEECFKFGLQIFGACVQAPNKLFFINPILQLREDCQMRLMNLIQTYGFFQDSNIRPPPSSSNLRSTRTLEEPMHAQPSQSGVDKREFRQLLQKVEAQQQQIEKFEKQALAEKKKKVQLENRIKSLEQENDRLRQELQNSIDQFNDRGRGESIIRVTAAEEASNALVQQLKLRLYRQSDDHMKQVKQLNQTIDFLKQKIERLSKQNAQQLQQNSMRDGMFSRVSSPVAEHPPCISLKKHHQTLTVQTEKVKQLMKAQWEHNLEVQKLNNKIAEQREEMSKLKEEFRQELQRKGDKISTRDYNQLKKDILKQLNEKFKVEAGKLKKETIKS